MKWNKLILSLILCFGIAALGSTLTIPSVTGWFSTLNKPPFSPPNWLFGPVWSVLYLLMAVSFYLIWSKKHSPFAIRIFLLQLFLNLGWSFIFFYLHRPGLAFLEILILWWAILATIKTFYKTYHLAAYLLYPYLAWVSFAAFLNFSLWQLNR